MTLGALGVISLDPWDSVLRRNQHLALRMLEQGLTSSVLWVDPPAPARRPSFEPHPGVKVVTPPHLVPSRLGGRHVTAAFLRRHLRGIDVLWVNDPNLGAAVRKSGRTFYDVTDDWRTAVQSPRRLARLVRSEDQLTAAGPVIVCSDVLAARWRERYGVCPTVVKNAADVEAIRNASPAEMSGPAPHVGYVGTLHDERLDADLVWETAEALTGGTLHLVGPNHLAEATTARLSAHPSIRLHGPVPASQVPSWLSALDVLVCPHLVSPFTMSLDAIKAYEYLASSKPVVATPTSGFQLLIAEGLTVATDDFASQVARATADQRNYQRPVPTWDDRAREFAAAIEAGLAGG